MSISSLGTAGSGVSQIWASLLSRLQQSNDASSTPASASVTPAVADSDDDGDGQSSNALTGSTQGGLSSQIVSMMVFMQAGGFDPSSNAAGTTSASGSDPAAQAFAGLDTDGDGTISQSELETAIGNAGGTTGEADQLYAALGGTSANGISESSFASAAQAGAPPAGGPGGAQGHHHHHSGGAGGASDEASQILAALGGGSDGTVPDDTLASALGSSDPGSDSTASSGSSSSSDMLATIDSNGDGSVSGSELANYIQSLQQQSQTDQSSQNALWKLAGQSYGASQGSPDSSNGNNLALTA